MINLAIKNTNPNSELSNKELISKLGIMYSSVYGISNKFLDFAEWANKNKYSQALGLKDFVRAVVANTAIKLYFGGVGKEETFETGTMLIEKGVGVIVDFCGAEGDIKLDDKRLEEVNKNYDDSLDICNELSEHFQGKESKERISVALKVTNFAEGDELIKISGELEKIYESQPELSLNPTKAISLLSKESIIIYNRYKDDVFSKLIYAQEKGFTAFIDAELESMNPAIDLVAKDALYNGIPVNVTIQTYLDKTHEKQEDLAAFAEQEINDGSGRKIKEIMGAKIVRGAYIDPNRDKRLSLENSEGRDAAIKKFPLNHDKFERDENVHSTKVKTDEAFDKSFEDMFKIGLCEITLATMNQASLDKAEDFYIKNKKLHPDTKVDAAYLRGMRGNLRIPNAFRRSEYLPWVSKGGELDALAYTGRRGTEQLTAW